MAKKDKTSETADMARKVKWDDSRLESAYANVANVSCTREEVTLLFGTNQTWHAGQKDLTILLSHRIMLSPFAAKRMLMLLDATIKKYEATFGDIVIESPTESG